MIASRLGASIGLLALLCSCAVGPDYTPPETAIATDWADDGTMIQPGEAIATKWWERFDDPQLTMLMTEAAEHNLNIGIALANVERARALRRIATAPFFPQVAFNVDATRQSFPEATSGNRFFAEQERDSFNAFFDAAWELDLFGRIRRSREAANARLDAAQENRRDVLMVVLAETAQSYFSVRGLQKRIAVLEQNLDLLGEVEGVAETQFEAGVTTEFDYTTAVGERQRAASLLPALQADLAAAIYRLSVLTGKDPAFYREQLAAPAPLPAPPDVVALGLRAELLRRRPDLRRAERELAAATAEIGVAIGDLFPRLTLTGSIGSSSLEAGDLLTSAGLNHNIGALLSLPVFQGGAGFGAVDAARADARTALLAYQQTVLRALEEAEAALVRYDKEWETLQLLQSARAQRQEAYRIARLRYESGEESFLIMLDAERSLVTAEDELVQSELRILTYLTQLYKALGGGWQAFEPVAPTAENPAESTKEKAQE